MILKIKIAMSHDYNFILKVNIFVKDKINNQIKIKILKNQLFN